ncbi:CAAX prenyl protease-related protein [Trichloromonas acetexigens]|uniref:CAAX prenyl protease-related protein n=1 Tax=Trichloromonas acetexigens TaxID=38815 RepID=A0A550JJE2_9BACT|nr:CAAX prenyl protease-related protein [Desulfuromonas acetexigens]TRO83325.1 CAAX prenyl protease-related protein [Desulfuromonas acetexigens]
MGSEGWIRIAPFALFMGFIGVEEGARFLTGRGLLPWNEGELLYLYPVKAALVGLCLVLLWRRYTEIRLADLNCLRHTALSLLSGILIFILWINMDWGFATLGEPRGFDPGTIPEGAPRTAMIAARLAGAVLVVPVMEELFWRSFLLRYVIEPDFMKIAIGRFTWFSFLATMVLFGLEHNHYLAGMMAGAFFNLLLYRTKSIAQCILSHAVANLALGIYVLQTGKWPFW